MNSEEAFKKDQETEELYRQKNPELVTYKKIRPETETFEKIGIWNMPSNRPKGYIRLNPQDFIVEEITQTGEIIKINSNLDIKSNIKRESNQNTLYFHLIKIGIDTNLAIERISNRLKIDKKNIGYSGLKDADAITAQLISLTKTKLTIENISNIKIPNLILNNIYYDQGALSPGNLQGNLFTITIRTENNIEKEWLKSKVEILNKHGFLNYFQSQRFGRPRLKNHHLGKYIYQGKYDEAIKYLLFKTSEYELPIITQLRQNAEKLFPDWNKIYDLFKVFPHTLLYEVKVLECLINNHNDYIGSLNSIQSQTQIYIYAYANYLYNKILSEYSKKHGCTNEKIPILLSNDQRDLNVYENFLKEDNTSNFKLFLKPFKFIIYKKRLINGRLLPKVTQANIIDKNVIILFSLPKGAYATTFLSNLFELYEGFPIPSWVDSKQFDPKKILNEGNIDQLKDTFKNEWYSKPEVESNLKNK